MSHLETAIIGSGPYGLSLAAHLRHQGAPFGLFGQPMQSWSAYMPKGMLLKSEPFASNLWDPLRANTLEAFCYKKRLPYRPTGWPVPIDTFLAYAAWFQERTGVSPNGSTVTKIDIGEQGMFSLTTSDGRQWTARHVVLATGHMPFMYIPEPLRELPDTLLVHTAQLHDLTKFRGQGRHCCRRRSGSPGDGRAAGRSRRPGSPPRTQRDHLESAEQGKALRCASAFAPLNPALRRDGAACSSRRCRGFSVTSRSRGAITSSPQNGVPRARPGSLTVWSTRPSCSRDERIESAEAVDGRVRLVVAGPQGAETIDTDTVIAGTGFKADIDKLAFLSEKLRAGIVREDRAPKLTASFETSIPNLFVVGILSAPTFGPVMRFMFGAKHPAAIVSRRIAARSSRPKKRVSIGAINAPAESLSQRP